MSSERDSFELPSVIAAAHRRRRRGSDIRKKKSHNYLAETRPSHGKDKINVKRPGAPPGNLNAVRLGKGDPDLVALFVRVRAFHRRARAAVGLVRGALRDGHHPDAVGLRVILERS